MAKATITLLEKYEHDVTEVKAAALWNKQEAEEFCMKAAHACLTLATTAESLMKNILDMQSRYLAEKQPAKKPRKKA